MSEEDPGYPSDKADKVLVRMPDGMRDRIKAEAKANNRTMNAEIVARLQFTLQPPLTPRTMDLVEETALIVDEVFSPEQLQQLGAAAVEAIRNTVVQVKGLRPVTLGVPTVTQDPPPSEGSSDAKK